MPCEVTWPYLLGPPTSSPSPQVQRGQQAAAAGRIELGIEPARNRNLRVAGRQLDVALGVGQMNCELSARGGAGA